MRKEEQRLVSGPTLQEMQRYHCHKNLWKHKTIHYGDYLYGSNDWVCNNCQFDLYTSCDTCGAIYEYDDNLCPSCNESIAS